MKLEKHLLYPHPRKKNTCNPNNTCSNATQKHNGRREKDSPFQVRSLHSETYLTQSGLFSALQNIPIHKYPTRKSSAINIKAFQPIPCGKYHAGVPDSLLNQDPLSGSFAWPCQGRAFHNLLIVTLKYRLQMRVKLPSWLPRARAFWPTVIRAAHFPVTPWRMKATWRHPTSLCLPASLQPYRLLCTRSHLRTLRTCHSQVCGETRKHT